MLVVAAHPDDEVLGCGGTIAKHRAKGDCVHVAFLADGVSSRDENAMAALERRRDAARKACGILGTDSVSFGDYPDNRMDVVPLLDITKSIELLIAEHGPNIVYSHHAGDVNVDHRQIHSAVVTACRPQKGHPVERLLFFEIASSTEWQPPGSAPAFLPNWFEDISNQLERKLAAMAAYDMELRDWPHPRSLKGIETLSAWRGAIVGVDAAEAFILGRQVK